MSENTIVLKTDSKIIDLLTNINTKLDVLLNRGTGVVNLSTLSKDVDVKTMANEVVNKIEEAKETAVVGETTKEEKIEEVKYILEDVREKLTILARAGKQKEVKALVTKFGAEKISALDPKHFAEVMAEAERL
ncbi:hypothetical protein [Metaclostridioides mangenotii]|uniref:hypothetical protein n=1 Tax=Metaclostridioides mangenotii TaxID=1540 RepID=UPI0028F04079|nr:hypothetical protein [Clostridioides mangenotii]